MSPRAKSPAVKSKAEKATASKFVRTITTTASTSRDTGVDGVRTPGDWAGKFDLRNANNPGTSVGTTATRPSRTMTAWLRPSSWERFLPLKGNGFHSTSLLFTAGGHFVVLH